MKYLCVHPVVSLLKKRIGFAVVFIGAWCVAGPAPAGAPDPDEIMRILEQERARRKADRKKSPTELMAEKIAQQERIKRRETRLVISNLIRQAGLLAKDDPDQAASLYQNAIRMGREIEAEARTELEAAEMGLTGIRLKQARAAQKQHQFLRANAIAESILTDIPNSPDVLAFNRQNERAQASYEKTHPSFEASYRVKELRERRDFVAKLLHDAKFLYQLGDYGQAQNKFRQVIALEPTNDVAHSYLGKISKKIHTEAVMARERGFNDKLNQVDRAWTEPERIRGKLPVPNPFYKRESGSGARPSQGRVRMLNKLQSIVIPQLNALDKFSMTEVVEMLDAEIRKLDPDGEGVNFTINPIIPNAVPAQTFAMSGIPQGAHAAVARQMVTGDIPEVPVDPQSGLPRDPTKPAQRINPFAQARSLGQSIKSFDPGTVKVKGLYTPLRRLTAAQILDVVTKSFDTPITYTITDHSVELRYKQPQDEKLFRRTFRIKSNTFGQGMGGLVPTPRGGDALALSNGLHVQRAAFTGTGTMDPGIRNAIPGGGGGGVPGGGGGGGGGTGPGVPSLPGITTPVNNVAASQQARTFFEQLGIPMGPNVQIFFNGRSGDLLVRAPLGTLELIEQVIEIFNASPPQLQIEAKFAEIAHNHGKSLGFDWFLGQSRMMGGSIINSPGSAPSMIGKPTRNNPSGFFPYPGTLIQDQFMPMPRQGLPNGTILPDVMEGKLTHGWKGYGNPLFTMTGILTDPQFRMVINALDETDAAELLSAPKVTTLSGVQARLSVQDQRTVVTGGNAQGTPGGGGGLGGGGGAGTGTINFQPQQMQFGPSLDVIPYVTADGFTIEMSLLPSISEFLGYEDSEFEMQALSGGQQISQSVPMPRFRQRQIASNCIVWDGQILMLGGLISDTVQINKDKVPFLGDIPFVGRLFRGEGTKSDKKNMMIFVKPTIIDPAGNRVNTPETLPYSSTEVPPQMPMIPAP